MVRILWFWLRDELGICEQTTVVLEVEGLVVLSVAEAAVVGEEGVQVGGGCEWGLHGLGFIVKIIWVKVYNHSILGI